MKQTAVEWLIEQMNNIKGSSTNMNGKVQFLEKELYNLFDEAKEMQKKQKKEYNYYKEYLEVRNLKKTK